MISTFYHLAFVSADAAEGEAQVSKLDLEPNVVATAEDESGHNGDAVWNSVHRVDRTPGLSFSWDKSEANDKLLSNLKIDRNNIVSLQGVLSALRRCMGSH